MTGWITFAGFCCIAIPLFTETRGTTSAVVVHVFPLAAAVALFALAAGVWP